LAERYQWKKTIGKVEDRENLINKWNNGFASSYTGLLAVFRLGFFEYFQFRKIWAQNHFRF
jgi:alpha-N-arabinofuranosidase